MIVKLYGGNEGNNVEAEHRYSPGKCVGTRPTNAFSKKVDNHACAVALSLHVLQLRTDFINRCASLPQCRPESRITSGHWKKLRSWLIKFSKSVELFLLLLSCHFRSSTRE